MNHPILAVVSRREFERLSRQVQLCEISWPQCYDVGPPIQSNPAPVGGNPQSRVELPLVPPAGQFHLQHTIPAATLIGGDSAAIA